MKRIKQLAQSSLFFPCLLLAGFFFYYLHHFDYIEMPTEDYIGNFRPFVLSILSGDLSSISNKLLPAYPFLLAAISFLVPNTYGDAIYIAAITINFMLLLPFLCLAYMIYKRFLGYNFAFFALLFLGVNVYTLYSGLNAELEIFLCVMILLSIYLMSKKSWIGLFPSAITAVIKWDAVFMILAYAVHIFNRTKKIKHFILSGLLAAIPFLIWGGFLFFQKSGEANTYIGEIVHRGPNIYKYPIEALITMFGFPKWLLLDIYHGRDVASSILLIIIAGITLLSLLTLLVYGIKAIVKIKDELKVPLLIFSGGFFLIHLIYQNTKDRYVIPIIWLLIMLAVLGLKELITDKNLQRLKKIFNFDSSQIKRFFIFFACGILYIQSILILFEKHDLFLPFFALFIQIIIFCFLYFKTSLPLTKRLLAGMLAGMLCFLNIAYSRDTLNHFSLRRIEFKEAAIWFKQHAAPDDRLLMTETNVAHYYINMNRHDLKIIPTEDIKSTDVSNLLTELEDKKITHVFIDDFYISRLLVNDPNAIDRKAVLMKELRDAAPNIKSMRLLNTFKTYTGSEAYMYGFTP